MEYKLPFEEYSKSLKKGKLMGLKCNDCGTVTCPPTMACRECASINNEVTELSGMGEIVTFSISYVGAEGRQNEHPVTIVLVRLDEGPWIMGNLIDIEPQKVNMNIIGKRVKAGSKMFPGDKYSVAAARPLFSFV
ncbi:MAG TPA: Zn-ribbon domain-containing OB-fold protein [Syntrophomonadaceae bacterium]|nr:Zn-ribbon domain-containing OB-fold protein [Syntrophomonadaceae bacterium]HPR92794.1 Zn-ribbon domain-containing OB-fold protein [Syntrophomonadaceae bacterium]